MAWDRGDDTIALFTWMERLRSQTHEGGGTMLSILGNHEWMNAIGNLLSFPITFGILLTTCFQEIGGKWTSNQRNNCIS